VRKGGPANKVEAVCVGDFHGWHSAPVSRGDPDWFEAMARPWRQVEAISNAHKAPILFSGDMCDRWNAPAEWINWAIRTLPKVYGIPGQHDLPYHRYADIKRSAYWTLVECGTIIDLKPGKMECVSDNFAVMGFPWGTPLKPWVMGPPIQGFNVALVHHYVWNKKHSYPGAPPGSHARKLRAKLKGYRVAVFGDNHKGFLSTDEETTILNCGGMMRRKSDEEDYVPKAGLIWTDGSVTRVPLDTSEDILLSPKQLIEGREEYAGFDQFLETVKTLGNSTADFLEAIEQALDTRHASKKVRSLVTRYLEGK
jgi:hypothetical protein